MSNIGDIQLRGDGAWAGLGVDNPSIVYHTDVIHVAALENGMVSGKPSIAIRLDVRIDNKPYHVITELSAEMLMTVTRAVQAKWPLLEVKIK